MELEELLRQFKKDNNLPEDSEPLSSNELQSVLDNYRGIKRQENPSIIQAQPQIQTPVKNELNNLPIEQEFEAMPEPKPENVVSKEPEQDYNKMIADAISARNTTNLLSNLGRAGQRIGYAIAGVKEPGTEFYDNLDKQADSKLLDVKNRIDTKASSMNIKNQQDYNDPNSKISQSTRNLMINKFGVPKEELEGQSYNQMKNLVDEYLKLKMHQENIDARKMQYQMHKEQLAESKAQRKGEFDTRIAKDYQAQAEKASKAAREQLENSDKIEGIVNQAVKGNSMALASLGTVLAKAMGDRGALSEGDVKRHIQNPALASSVTDWINRSYNGQLTPATGEMIKEVQRVIRGRLQDDISKSYDRFSSLYAKNTNTPIEEARQRIIPDDDYTTKNILKQNTDQLQNKTIVKKGYNPKTNQTQFIYSDGSKEIKDGRL